MFDSIIIVGATATGKTELSVELAKKLNGEIINADSQQIYKNLNIGTAKVTTEEMQGILHHLFDIIEIGDDFSVSEYKKLAVEKIKEIKLKNKLPIIVGGTGFYIEALLYNLEYGNSEKDEVLREYYTQMAKDYGNEAVYNKLKELDYTSAKKLHPNDLKRVIRAIEIASTSNIKKSEQTKTKANIINPLMIYVYSDREALYNRINLRVDKMLKNGLFSEIEMLNDKNLFNSNIKLPISYSEWGNYFNNTLSQNEVIELIKQHTRNYAKRQITWFKRYDYNLTFDLSKQNINDCIAKIIKVFCE